MPIIYRYYFYFKSIRHIHFCEEGIQKTKLEDLYILRIIVYLYTLEQSLILYH